MLDLDVEQFWKDEELMHAEDLIYLYYDDPDLFAEFGQGVGDVILAYIKLFIREAGKTEADFVHGGLYQ